MGKPKRSGRPWQRIREQVLQRDGHACVRCGSTDRLQVDHITEVRHTGGVPDNSMRNLQTLCHRCHVAKTNEHGNAKAKPKTGTRPGFSGPAGSPRSATPKIAGGARLTGTEPAGQARYASEPHPDAAGTMADEFAAWMMLRHGIELLPWQRQVADRVLEVDGGGRWCWPTCLVFVPRQCGKTTLIGGLCEWRAIAGEFVILGANKLTNSEMVIRDPAMHHREADGHEVSLRRDLVSIRFPSQGRWLAMAANSAFCRGYSVDLVVMDEVQAIDTRAYESAAPSQAARPNPQMLMVGTAPTVYDSGELFDRMRSAALAGSDSICLMEWSAAPEDDWMSEETWRLASPVWTPGRLKVLRERVQTTAEDGFRPEYLCTSMAASASPWLPVQVFDSCRDRGLVAPERPVVAALEEPRGGRGGVVALGWRDGDTRCVTVAEYGSMEEAWESVPVDCPVLVGASLAGHPEARARAAQLRGRRETSASLGEFRRLVPDQLRWNGDVLGLQVRSVNVTEDAHGTLQVQSGNNTAPLRAAAWAVHHMRDSAEPLLLG